MSRRSDKGDKGDIGKQGPPGVQGVPGHTGMQGLQGQTGPKGKAGDGTQVTINDLMRAIKYASGFGVAGLVCVGLALAIFVTTAASERQQICDVVVKSVEGNSEALIAATSAMDRTDEERARYDLIVADYRARVDAALEGCR